MSAFVRERVVPDIIDKEPANKLQVSYPSGVVVDEGNCLTPAETKDTPMVSWPAEEHSLYTLVMVDPDAPFRRWGFLGPAKHWLVVNIPGSDVTEGQVIADYGGPGPPKFTGLHRYIFLVYKQPNRIEDNDTPSAKGSLSGRIRWNVKEYCKKHNLGQPIAANFFQAKG